MICKRSTGFVAELLVHPLLSFAPRRLPVLAFVLLGVVLVQQTRAQDAEVGNTNQGSTIQPGAGTVRQVSAPHNSRQTSHSDQDGATMLNVAFKLRDGSRLFGTMSRDTAIPLHTRFGDLSITMGHTRSVEFDGDRSAVKVHTNNGDILIGLLERKHLKLTTSVGDVIADVSRIAHVDTAPERLLPSPDQLVAYYRFEAGPTDETGENHGQIKGAKVVDGRNGRALLFDGSDHVEIPHSRTLDITESLTIAAWVKLSPKFTDSPREHGQVYLVTKGSKFGAGTYRLYASTHMCPWHPETFGFNIKTAGGPKYGESVVAKPESGNAFDENWHHVVGTFDGTQMKLYIDGKETATRKVTGKGRIISAPFDLNIGGWGPWGYRMMRGAIDDVQVYRTALTPEEIVAAMKR